ncbi:MAG: hypothetical protein JNL87_18090 [Burkholderiaceae bacterium]|nr:hypothetical protein [Burkholderiaceae bacterium]
MRDPRPLQHDGRDDAGSAEPLVIDPLRNGPRSSGNGGWVAGSLALRLGTPVTSVALRAPVPLGTPLQLRLQPDGSLTLGHAGTVVAEAAAATLELGIPPPPDLDAAEAAGVVARLRSERRGATWPYAHCFACGFARTDGLAIIPGPVGDDGLVATTWTPPAWVGGADGRVRVEATWAALDCPAGIAWSHRLPEGTPIVTVRMTASVERPLAVGERCRVIAWPIARDGRKLHAGSAIVDDSGTVRARSRQLWLIPRDA